ncbi:MAG: HD domain-containing protein [Syntrophobacteraceae bacterium]|nr:HD domain-containing protein [Syntrophobacteraceae bacterium]
MEYRKIIDFFFELGMLKKTPRSGFQFLGSGGESVADHSFRVAMIGFALARLDANVDPFRVLCMCLVHDLPEARIGDQNYVNKRYVTVDESAAMADLADSLPFGDELKSLLKEYRDSQTDEARLVHDADQLELIVELKEQNDLGNSYASKWIHFARQRLVTPTAKKIAEQILSTDSTDWWFKGHDDWWGKKHGE